MSSMQRTIARNVARIADGGRVKRHKKAIQKAQLKLDREKYAQMLAAKKAKKDAKKGIFTRIRNALRPKRGTDNA